MANNVEILLCYPGLFLRLAEVSTPMMQIKISQNVNYNLYGLSCVTHPEFIRNGNMTGFKTGLYEVEHPLAGFEVRDPISHKISETLMHSFKI